MIFPSIQELGWECIGVLIIACCIIRSILMCAVLVMAYIVADKIAATYLCTSKAILICFVKILQHMVVMDFFFGQDKPRWIRERADVTITSLLKMIFLMQQPMVS